MAENDSAMQAVQTEGQLFAFNKFDLVDVPQVPEIYANSVQPAFTSFEITLHFGSLMGVENGVAKVARRVSIVMSPEVAKLLFVQLNAGLKSYEERVRPIPLHLQAPPQPASTLTPNPDPSKSEP